MGFTKGRTLEATTVAITTVPADARDVGAGALRVGLETVLARYLETSRGEPFGRTIRLWPPFEEIQNALAASDVVRARATLRVSWSVGHGGWAKLPWVALLDDRETTSTRRGLYGGFIFRRDMSGVYLTLTQGISEPQERLGRARARAFLRARADDLRGACAGLEARGFSLDDSIDLRADAGPGGDYRSSTVAHKLYEAGAVPDDPEILADVGALVEAYDRCLRPPAATGPRSRAWIFDAPRRVTRAAAVAERGGGAGESAASAGADDAARSEERRPPLLDLRAVHASVAAALTAGHLAYGPRHDELVRTFLASLAAKRFAILTGLAGSGKTQLALRFGEWLGAGRHLVAPVRPDWTGAETIFGYEDALQPAAGGRRAWHVPEPLAFMLRAARDSAHPHLVLLDEMNLAHVERYLADLLSGMESGVPCLPNLARDADGQWRLTPGGPARLRVPDNLFVVGTVNVDETTYQFSPKVLDRANTLEFRVDASDLSAAARKPTTVAAGPNELVRGFLEIARDDDWHRAHPSSAAAELDRALRRLHALLADGGFEFGHRTFYEAMRFAAMLEAAGDAHVEHALDRVVMQKLLPRLHGSRRRLEPTLSALARFCLDPGPRIDGDDADTPFDPLAPSVRAPALPLSFDKLRRMTRSVRANQFASFAE